MAVSLPYKTTFFGKHLATTRKQPNVVNGWNGVKKSDNKKRNRKTNSSVYGKLPNTHLERRASDKVVLCIDKHAGANSHPRACSAVAARQHAARTRECRFWFIKLEVQVLANACAAAAAAVAGYKYCSRAVPMTPLNAKHMFCNVKLF